MSFCLTQAKLAQPKCHLPLCSLWVLAKCVSSSKVTTALPHHSPTFVIHPPCLQLRLMTRFPFCGFWILFSEPQLSVLKPEDSRGFYGGQRGNS